MKKITRLGLFAFLVLFLNGTAIKANDHQERDGQVFGKSVTDLPYHENFDDLEVPALPDGWSAIIKSTNVNARIESTTIGNPVSLPYQVRGLNLTDVDAVLYLVTPEITPDLNTIRIRFFASVNTGTNNTIEVVAFDPEDESFTVVETITPTGDQQEYLASFGSYSGDHSHIALRMLPGSTNRVFFVDNFIVEQIPAGPLAEIRPYSCDFGQNQIGIAWPAKQFSISNVGVSDLTLSPGDISITGADASDFVLGNISQTMVLSPFESVNVSVSFYPQSTGDKLAALQVSSATSPLTGEGIDATISDFPHLEDFNDTEVPALPFGWSEYVESFNPSARIETTTLSDPVSPPNQFRFINLNDPDPELIFISPPIQGDMDRLRIKFHGKSLSGVADAIEVGTYDHGPDGGFTAYQSVTLSSGHVQYQVDFNNYTGNDQHLAFRGVPEASARAIYFDNVIIDLIPVDPVAELTPDSWLFSPTEFGETSEEKTFTIKNIGGGHLVLNPEDITIGGADASDFVLNNISGQVSLATNQSTTFGVSFAPAEIGIKEATLQVAGQQAQLSGESYTTIISHIPHYEDFNNLELPDLPFGWTSFIESTAARALVGTTYHYDPNSPPNHARFLNFEDPDAILILISPVIEHPLNELRVSFYCKANLAGAHMIEVGTYDPEAEEPFTVLTTFDVTSINYNYYFLDLDEYQGTDNQIAIRAVQAQAHRWILLDDFRLEEIPEYPVIEVTPLSFNFQALQKGTVSAPRTFTINNGGGDTLRVSSGDIILSGENSADFVLHNLEQPVELLAGETATISVAFAPQSVGVKETTLMIHDFEIPLTGEGFDATVTEFPWLEDFSGVAVGHIPFGWIRSTTNWGVHESNFAGGQTPEMRFYFGPNNTGELYLMSPLLNTSSFDEMLLSFRHRVNNYETPGLYSLKVVTIVDDVEYLVHEWVDPDNMPAELFSAVINTAEHGVGAENMRVALVFDGPSMDINQWYVDDILLREVPDYYTVDFSVVENSSELQPIEDVIIRISGMDAIITDQNGQASIVLEPGDYTAEVLKQAYLPVEVQFAVTDEDKSIQVKMKDNVVVPSDLYVDTQNLPHGDAQLSWILENAYFEFRYDDGEAETQIGYPSGTINSVLGALHHYDAEIHEISWYQTDEGGPHHVVNIWVLGVDHNGMPDRNNVLYQAQNVSTVDFQWSTHIPDNPIEAPEGFFLGLSYQGFLGLAVDDGQGEPWDFVPGKHFGVFRITDPSYAFIDITEWDYSNNFLLRAHGVNRGTIDYDKNMQQDNGLNQGPAPVLGAAFSPGLDTGKPSYNNDKASKAFAGFNVYLDDLQNPVAENIQDNEFLFQDLEPGSYTAGVQAVYTTGISEIATVDFVIDEAQPLYAVTFEVNDNEGAAITDAVITLDGYTEAAGVYFFEGIAAGTYNYAVNREGFFENEGQVTVTDSDRTVTVVLVSENVSVGSVIGEDFRIYPNPASQYINIESGKDIIEIRVVDMLGQVVFVLQEADSNTQVNISSLREGVYFLNVITSEGQHTQRFIISR